MTRVKRGNVARKRRQKVLQIAQGFRGSSSRLFRTAQQQTMKALRYSYRDRRQKKRQYASLWVSRLNAAAREYNIEYHTLQYGLKKSEILLNRKVLSQVALRDRDAFQQLIRTVREQAAL